MRSDKFGIPEHGGFNDLNMTKKMLDFSANLNPLGMPENVRKALLNSVNSWERYPDPDCTELTKRLSERFDVASEKVVCGSGADDLIYRIAGAVRPKKAAVTVPCFSEYKKALAESGAEVREYRLYEENGFLLNSELIKVIFKRLGEGDMLILGSPNNPTGRVIPSDLLYEICSECERRGIIFLCDECFFEFTKNAASVCRWLFFPSVIMLSAFTKTYAMAGLRLGYAVFGSGRLADTVRRRGQFWNVSAPAQTAGIAALDSGDYLERSRRLISEQRNFLKFSLSDLGIKVFDSDADFLLLKTEIPLYDGLYGRGIIVRRCANFGGLNDKFYRIAVRTESENAALISALQEIVLEKNNG